MREVDVQLLAIFYIWSCCSATIHRAVIIMEHADCEAHVTHSASLQYMLT